MLHWSLVSELRKQTAYHFHVGIMDVTLEMMEQYTWERIRTEKMTQLMTEAMRTFESFGRNYRV